MCLGIPGRITEIYERNGQTMSRVDFGGASREVCLDLTPDAKVGNWVIVHVGFALNVLDEAEAQATLDLLREIGVSKSEADEM